MWYNIGMRKLFLPIVILTLVVALCLTGCEDKDKNESEYFVSFLSQGQFSTVTERFTLEGEQTQIYSYDVEEDVFVTIRPVLNDYVSDGYIYLYGIVGSDGTVYAQPTYYSVVAIQGDFAIVTKPGIVIEEGTPSFVPTVGVIRFRGEGVTAPIDLTDFLVAYNTSFNQYAFVGEYVVCPGNKDYPFSTANFSTFYDCSTGRLLEKFAVRCDITYEFAAYDDYLVAKGKDHAFFYNVTEIEEDGYLFYDRDKSGYIAFPEDTEGEFTENIELDIYYLGNGWFSRTARLVSEEVFQGYNMIYEDFNTTTGETTTVYALIKCDFYNAKFRSQEDKQGLIVDNVANEYYTDYYAQMGSALNNMNAYDENTGIYDYALPYMDVSAMVKKGYSIVYYYYFPYVDRDDAHAEITFCIMQGGKVIHLEDMLMPTVFVDGVGTETSDPLYEQYYGNVSYFDTKLDRHDLISLTDDISTYATYVHHNGGTVASQIDKNNVTIKYGCVNKEGRIIVPFVYDELSPFYGEYAIGSKKVNGKEWYRIDKDGNEQKLDDVVNVRQGVYVYEYHGKLGLKNYAGDIIIEASYDRLDVYDVFLTGNRYQTSYVIAGTGEDGMINKTTVFALS